MITANELRIGNWLEFDNYIQQSKFIQVGRRFFSSASIDGTEENFRVSEYYHPIPLTEEILLKCGFEIKKDEYGSVLAYQKGIKPLLISGRMKGYYTASCDYNIQYLHELQNLYYAITKTELIITP
jgi:hypothetical protein